MSTREASSAIFDEPVLFLGAGKMGLPIIRRLVETGVKVETWDVDPSAQATAGLYGAVAAPSARVLELDYRYALLCLPEPAVVNDFIEQWCAGRRTASARIVADFTTVSQSFARSACAKLRNVGVDYIEAPLSGGERGAQSGELVVMASGRLAAYEQIKPLLSEVGNTLHYFGETGTASQTKAVNQFVYLAYNYAFANGLKLADELGLKQDLVLDVLRKGAAGHPLIEDRLDRVLASDYQEGFLIHRCLKDLDALEAPANIDPDTIALLQLMKRSLAQAVASTKGNDDILGLMRS